MVLIYMAMVGDRILLWFGNIKCGLKLLYVLLEAVVSFVDLV